MKAQMAVDPIDRLFQHKDKLEKLGVVGSDKVSAQEQMYAMDRKKLDTLLDIAMDKSRSTERKVDSLVAAFGPLAREYVRATVMNMRAQQGGPGEEAQRTEEDAEKTLRALEDVDRAMSSRSPMVVSVKKTKKEAKQKEIKKE